MNRALIVLALLATSACVTRVPRTEVVVVPLFSNV